MIRDDLTLKNLQTKAGYYYTNQQFIHIKKLNGEFHNGSIVELSADFIIFLDRYQGNVMIFFSEIDKIESFKNEVKK